jgi:hypothetical protein
MDDLIIDENILKMSLVNIRDKEEFLRQQFRCYAIVLSLLAKTMAKFLHEYTYQFCGLFSRKNKRATCSTARYVCS